MARSNLRRKISKLGDKTLRGGSERRKDANLGLLEKLLADSVFLANEPLLEDALAERLEVSKPSLRESLGWFFGKGLLKRAAGGIRRDILTPTRLNELIGLRWQIERFCFRRLVEHPRASGIADNLISHVKQPQALAGAECTAVEWYLRSVDAFHVEVAERADAPDFARILRDVILQVRIGTCAPTPSGEERALAENNDLELISAVGEGGVWDRNWELRLQRHIATVWLSALARLGKHPTTDRDRQWRGITGLFVQPVSDEDLLAGVFEDM